MTNSEAIAVLMEQKRYVHENSVPDQALDMGIKALSQLGGRHERMKPMGRLINTDDLKRMFGFCHALWYTDDEPKLYEHLVETIIDNCPTAKQPECEYMKALHKLEDRVAALGSEIGDLYYGKSNER